VSPRRGAAAAALLLGLLAAAAAQVARKGGPERGADALLREGFESRAWEIGWTTVDADGSGTSWARFSEDDWYEARGGSWSIGCRYNADGSANDDWLISPPLRPDSTNVAFSFWYRSQDPAYAESFEVRSLRLAAGSSPSGAELAGRLADFALEGRVESAPTVWTQWTRAEPLDEDAVWVFAVRCVSRDRFTLLVDDVVGPWAVPRERWFLEEAFRRADWGLVTRDSTLARPFRLWNLDEDSLLEVRVAGRPASPFVFSSWFVADTVLLVQPDDTLGFVAGARGRVVVDGDTTWTGSFADTLRLELTHRADGAVGTLEIPFTAAVWDPDSLQDFLLAETFEEPDSLLAWTAALEPCAADTLSWRVGEYSSSQNFTVPHAGGRFAYVNSDARGRFLPDGTPMRQCALLVSPWFDPGRTTAGEPAAALLLGLDLVYDELGGGVLELLADAGAGWETVHRPAPAPTAWERRSVDLSAWCGADSLRLAWRFEGSWAQGAALDGLLLLPVPQALPGQPLEAAPALPAQVAVTIAPNPFNPATTVRLDAPEPARLTIAVYNLLGERVLEQGPLLLRRGANAFPLDLGGRAAGLYFVRLEALQADGRRWSALRKATYLK